MRECWRFETEVLESKRSCATPTVEESASNLIDDGAYAPIFCSTGFQARSLRWQRQTKGSARSEELQCDWQGVFKSKNFNRHMELVRHPSTNHWPKRLQYRQPPWFAQQ